MPSPPATVAVGLCDGLGRSRIRIDPETVCRSLRERLPGVRAAVIPELCRRPEQAAELAVRTRAERLVLGLCDSDTPQHEFQRRAREGGLDPFALEVVRLFAVCSESSGAEEVALRLQAAVARARAFRGSEPEQLRPRFVLERARLSRKALLALPPLVYEAVAGVEERSCPGATRCGLCIEACPEGAIRTEAGRVVIDGRQCVSCGLCLTACPAGAIDLPGSSLCQYEAEVAALLEGERPALLFACRRLDGGGLREASDLGWLPIELPCLGMVTPGWLLQALARGAAAVGLASCGRGCSACADSLLERRTDYVRAFLSLVGDRVASQRVQFVLPGHANRPPSSGSFPAVGGYRRTETDIVLSEPAATVQAALSPGARVAEARELSLGHGASPLGIVTVRQETCTTCGACAGVCPTGALALEGRTDSVVLSYDATRCVACGRCAEACPEAAEGTLRVEPITDLTALRSGRAALKHETFALCESCGRPIGPQHMLERIADLLGREPASESLLRLLGTQCPDCRSSRRLVAQTPAERRSELLEALPVRHLR